MKSQTLTSDILAALRAGKIELARELAFQAPGEEHDLLFARAMLSLLGGDFSADAIGRFAEVWPDSPYLDYINAYLYLKNGDEEKALFLYTRLVEVAEGWLARELIEKSKKNLLVELARENSAFFFIPLPEVKKTSLLRRVFLARPKHSEAPLGENHPTPVIKHNTFWYIFNRNSARLLLLALLLLLAAGIGWQVLVLLRGANEKPDWRQLNIDEAAHILPGGQGAGEYRYVSRNQLLEDFQQARAGMAAGKINQTRYLLQRILLSNADFRSREKARLFLNFIPVPDYQKFSDNVPAADLLREPALRAGSYLVWEGEMKQWRKEQGGYRGSMVLSEHGETYLVEIFWPDAEVMPGSKPEDFYEERASQQTARRAIVFGQFKNLVGRQKVIYLEAIRVWF